MARGKSAAVRTTLSYEEAAHIARSALVESSKSADFQKKQVGNDAFAGIDGYQFGVFASGKDRGIFQKQWALHIEIYDEGDHRLVMLGVEQKSFKEMATSSFAYSDRDIFTRHSKLNEINFDKKAGEQKLSLVIDYLRNADPALEMA